MMEMTEEKTTVWISKEDRQRIEDLKIIESEPNGRVIKRALDFLEGMSRSEG